LLIKVCIAKAMVLPVAMYGYESWIIKKAEHWRIDAFELCCWRRLCRAPWTARRSNQSILKEIIPEYSLEGLCWSWSSKTLATWCKELTHWKRPWCWEWLKAGREGDDRGWDGWTASLTQETWVWASSRKWRRQGSLVCCNPWGHKELDTTDQPNNNNNHWGLPSLVVQTVKNLPAMQDTQVLSLGWEDPLEKTMATHSSILAWRIPWTEEPRGSHKRVGHNWVINTFTFTYHLGWEPLKSRKAKKNQELIVSFEGRYGSKSPHSTSAPHSCFLTALASLSKCFLRSSAWGWGCFQARERFVWCWCCWAY